MSTYDAMCYLDFIVLLLLLFILIQSSNFFISKNWFISFLQIFFFQFFYFLNRSSTPFLSTLLVLVLLQPKKISFKSEQRTTCPALYEYICTCIILKRNNEYVQCNVLFRFHWRRFLTLILQRKVKMLANYSLKD